MIYLENEEKFNEIIKEKKVLVDFYATWCGPCNLISPHIEEIANENENLKVIKVDVDKFTNLSKKYGVMSIPTLIVFEEGKEVNKHIGYLEKKDIEALIK